MPAYEVQNRNSSFFPNDREYHERSLDASGPGDFRVNRLNSFQQHCLGPSKSGPDSCQTERRWRLLRDSGARSRPLILDFFQENEIER